jgi:hypothetical protein
MKSMSCLMPKLMKGIEKSKACSFLKLEVIKILKERDEIPDAEVHEGHGVVDGLLPFIDGNDNDTNRYSSDEEPDAQVHEGHG